MNIICLFSLFTFVKELYRARSEVLVTVIVYVP